MNEKSKEIQERTIRSLAIAAPFVIMIFLLVRNTALSSPIMGGDEYAYYSLARKIPNFLTLPTRDPYLQLPYNLVFLGLGKFFFLVSRNPESLMKVFNTVAFSMSVLIIWQVMRQMTKSQSPLYAPIILSVIPFSAFSAYFMPETFYALIFLSLASVLILLLPQYELLASCIAGILVGILVLIKAHGIAVFVSAFLTILSMATLPRTFRYPWRRVLISVGLFVMSAYLTEVVLNWVITRDLSWNPLLFVGSVYKSFLGNSVGVLSRDGFLVRIVKNAIGHIIILLFVCAIPLGYIWGWLWTTFFKTGSIITSPAIEFRRIQILVVFTLLATILIMAMTVNFTVQVSQDIPYGLARIHGRYYSFVLFLYLLCYFVLQKKNPAGLIGPVQLRVWGIIGLVAAVLIFWVQRAFTIYPWDYPDLFSVSLWQGYGAHFPAWLIIVIGLIVYGLISIKPRFHLILFPVFILLLFLASSYRTIAWQFVHSKNVAYLAAEGRALREILPETERSRGIIIGSDRYGKMAYFLFGFSSDARVLQVPKGESITSDMIPSDTDWVVLLDSYDLNIPMKSSMSIGEARLGWIPQLP